MRDEKPLVVQANAGHESTDLPYFIIIRQMFMNLQFKESCELYIHIFIEKKSDEFPKILLAKVTSKTLRICAYRMDVQIILIKGARLLSVSKRNLSGWKYDKMTILVLSRALIVTLLYIEYVVHMNN